MSTVRVVALNRYLPPMPGVTGALLWRLLAGLRRRVPDLELHAVGTDLAYGGPMEAYVPDPPVSVDRLASVQRRWGGSVRPLATLHDGWRMAREAARQAVGEADVVISLTDPPMLGHWLSRALRPRQRWIEWTMDAFPEALWAAAGLSPRGWPPPPGRAPDLRLCLGPGQAAMLARRGGAPPPTLILPAGITDPPGERAAGDAAGGVVRLVYAGNIGRAHPVDGLIALARSLDPARHHLTVHAHGSGAGTARAATAGLTAVSWTTAPLSMAALMAADVHVAGLRDDWTHVGAPSKAVTALCLGKPLLFLGSADSDIWRWVEGAGWRVGPDGSGVSAALDAMRDGEAVARVTERAREAGDRLRRIETETLDAVAAFLIHTR